MKPLLDERSRALINLGLLRPIDLGFVGVMFVAVFLLLAWIAFGTPSALGLLAFLAGLLAWLQCWMIVVIYRVALMILETRAEINLMPATAAQLVQQFNLGIRQPGPPAGA